MQQKLIIPGRLPGMNEIIATAKSHPKAYSREKKEYTNAIAWQCKAQKLCSIYKTIDVTIKWHCKDRRRDKDNITAGQKYILDGLQKARVIKNDNWECIRSLRHEFAVDKDNERIEIILKEVEE